MFLQIPQPTINHCSHGSGMLRSRAHKPAIASIRHPRRRRDEHYSARGDGINLNRRVSYVSHPDPLRQ
jgi:hypothetical protein